MPTRKLYYEDAHLKCFTAQVLSCTRTQNGWAVTLDATAFYPEGGGQAADTGTLGAGRRYRAPVRRPAGCRCPGGGLH